MVEWILAEVVIDGLTDQREAGHATDEQYRVDLMGGEVGLCKCLVDHREGALDQRHGQPLDDVVVERGGQADGVSIVVTRETRHLDGDGGHLGQGSLGSFRRVEQLGAGAGVGRGIDPGLGLELGHEVLGDHDVKVVAAEEGVACGADDFEQLVVEAQDGDIECAAAEVIDRDVLPVTLPVPVGECSCGGFVDDAQAFDTGDLGCVSRGLALLVVEVCRNGNHSAVDRLTGGLLGDGLHVGQHVCADFLHGVDLALHTHAGVTARALCHTPAHGAANAVDFFRAKATPDEALGREDGVVWGIGKLLSSRSAHDDRVAVAKRHHGRMYGATLRVCEDDSLAIPHGSYD